MLILSYLAGIITCLVCFTTSFRIIKESYFNFLTGTQLGFSFFVGGAIMVSLFFNGIPVVKSLILPIEPLTPDKDLNIYIIVLLGSIIFSALPYVGRGLYRRDEPSNVNPMRFMIVMTVLYVACAVVYFALSGKAGGGHWYKTSANLLKVNATAVVLASFTDIFRTAIPAGLVLLRINNRMSNKMFVFALASLAVFELGVTSNRIAIVYCAFAYVIANKHQLGKVILIGLLFGPPLLRLNSLFPIIRGLVFTHGVSVQGTEGAFSSALHEQRQFDPLEAVSTGMADAFEATDVSCLKYVINTYPAKNDYLYGTTFIVKSFTFFIPKSLWEDKPLPFSAQLGQEIAGAGGALNSTLLGESWANFGFASLIILPVFLAWTQSAYNLLRFGPMGNYVGLFIGIAMWRVDFSLAIISLFVIIIVSIFCRYKRGAAIAPIEFRRQLEAQPEG